MEERYIWLAGRERDHMVDGNQSWYDPLRTVCGLDLGYRTIISSIGPDCGNCVRIWNRMESE